ncbi:uncharacterized protein KY384_005545 [Bacidia gigantensis]|uniref:uncharacterized protein n=1 Tax=Bacidia gigantensis TaxID=2732470 RepID=UPI001D0534E0|nr:uncharacterized protein KY384_005545 [Bacidia gigantensis]KAG8530063.1 hypothetical protein KY384_005545 [Bacidia gigantensis]
MARGVGRTGPPRYVQNDFENRVNGEAPASTLAAQLVNQITDGAARGGSQREDTFRLLLQEVLQSEYEPPNTGGSNEANLSVNFKLIYVIVKAGLDNHQRRNPFVAHNNQVKQSIDSLKAIEIALCRTPNVLFSVSSHDEDESLQNVPLLLWLVPKILSLLKLRIHEDLKASCDQCLEIILSLEEKIRSPGLRLDPIFRYVRGCNEGLLEWPDLVIHILSSLESFDKHNNKEVLSTVNIPSEATLSSVLSFHDAQGVSPKLVCTTISSRLEASRVCVHLLRLLVHSDEKNRKSQLGTAGRPSLETAAQSLPRIWNTLFHETSSHDENVLPSNALCSLLDTTHYLLKNLVRDGNSKPQLDTLISALEIISVTLTSAVLPLPAAVEKGISINIFHVAYIILSANRGMLPDLLEHSFRLMGNVVRNEDRYPTFGQDLQQALNFVTYWHCNTTLSVKEAVLNTKLTLEDCTLRGTCEGLFDFRLSSPSMKYSTHPPKRARTSAASSVVKLQSSDSPLLIIQSVLDVETQPDLGVLYALANERYAKLSETEQCQIFQQIGRLACASAEEFDSTRAENPFCSHTLSVFLRQNAGPEMATRNRLVTLDYLRNLSERGDLSLQETCILALGQMIRNVEDCDELNLALLKLVEYLGHPNALLSSLSYDELQLVSNHSPFTALKLFAPYWRTIAVAVVQNLLRRPQLVQQIADLLAMSVPKFLASTQMHTVPYFVLRKQRELLQRIAEASNLTVMALCREHNNMAAILANILLQASSDVEDLVINLLHSVSPEFDNVDCAELLRSEPQATATELLKFAGEVDETRRIQASGPAIRLEICLLIDYQAQRALQFLAGVISGRTSSNRGNSKADTIESFFETHILGIMALLADTINDGKGPQPILEKRRCLKAIREMVKIAQGHISNGIPQVSSCLRSAIGQADLINDAFEAWIVMINLLPEDDLSALVEPTLALIVQHWESIDSTLQMHVYDMVACLFKSKEILIRDIAATLPSLAQVPLLSKYEQDLAKLKAQNGVKHHFQTFSQRCQSENPTVVDKALKELALYLEREQSFLHTHANSEQPDALIGNLLRSLLDTAVLFSNSDANIAALCAQCLGMVGCLDPTRVEAAREKKEILVLSNFTQEDEIRDFIITFLGEVLSKAFLSATNSRSQGFLAYAMQELLAIGDFQESARPRPHEGHYDSNYQRWADLPESTRTLLTPFLDSKYFVTAGTTQTSCVYPIFKKDVSHAQWLRLFTFDLLKKETGKDMVGRLFAVLSRIIRLQDIAIATFLLPFTALNTILNGDAVDKKNTAAELLNVLDHPLPEGAVEREALKLCSQTVFQVLDYLSRWMQKKKMEIANLRTPGTRASRTPYESDLEKDALHISSVEAVLGMIPADTISRRAVECESFARALFHWEQYIRQRRQTSIDLGKALDLEPYYARLQDIYTQIDEPDGIEGISSHLQVLDVDQQVLEHRKAGRWTAVQSWYELLLTKQPDNLDFQYNLLTSLKESGQHDVLLNQVDSFPQTQAMQAICMPFAAESSWATGKLDKLRRYIDQSSTIPTSFNIGVGRALLALNEAAPRDFFGEIKEIRISIAQNLSPTNTLALQDCHDAMLKLHVLAEMEAVGSADSSADFDRSSFMSSLNQRLDVLGPFLSNKQYILGLRRATMQASKLKFSHLDIASSWLTSAKLARKANFSHQAFNSVLHASQLGDASATIEHARLLWKEGNHRKAIQSLEGAIAANAFRSYDYIEANDPAVTNAVAKQQQQNLPKAKAHLLLAKWIDRAGQTQSDVIIQQYKKAVEFHSRWERGHYHLGKHYNKLLESEKAKPPAKQAQTFITGETAKLVVENYLRSLAFGAKYLFQTLPRILTLWLDLGVDSESSLDPKYGNDEAFRSHITTQRRKLLSACNSQIRKYIDRLPAWVFYTALSQLVARICHPSQAISGLLIDLIAKVVMQHTAQALWTLLAMAKSSSKDRANRGVACMTKTLENARKSKSDIVAADLKAFIAQGQKLSDQLLRVCETEIKSKAPNVHLSNDLGFKHSFATSKLAMPTETCLTASLPTSENVDMRKHRAFNSNDYVHISAFMNEVLVLNSLQRPRKISIRGSDGHLYSMLCKPKDDLRKDQRLMEFNAMINRSLKKDADSSKRRLYVKTYAVTPLNEECGLIEWVDGLRTLRDILLNIYKQKNVHINYGEIRNLLNESISAPNKLPIFTKKVISHFPPVFHEWFVEMFPEPGSWFAARLRYTRSCAVMSIVGHVLGLGDRHGENILFEEGNGGTFHVDFNCLFDKGLTFEKPELVPFRLTHNIVDAFGAYGHEGPFRKTCELTNRICRQNEDTLMTILETFLYDPTTDFIGKKKKRDPIVPETPEGVLESIRNKVRGLLPGESVPLSVEGYVDELITQATNPYKLASMYIGWCAFF